MAILLYLFDFIFNYYLNNNIFISCLFIIFIISKVYFDSSNKTLVFIIVLGILYDLLFSNILFIYLISFYLLYYFIIYIRSKIDISYFSYLLTLIISIIFLRFVMYFLLFILGLLNITQNILIVLILRDLLSSIIFSYLFYILFRKSVKYV